MKRGLLLLWLLWGFSAFSQSLLTTAESVYFDSKTSPRVGIEVELAGLSVDKVSRAAQKVLRGSVRDRQKLESYVDKKTGRIEHFRVTEKELVDSLIGLLAIKPEDNGTSNSDLKENFTKTRIVEIVTSPISFEQVILFQEALNEIRSQGGLGTEDGFPISIQVNVEMGKGKPENIKVTDVLSILRNYLKPLHRLQIAEELSIPLFRKKYLGLYSPEMMSRILDKSYAPSWEKFFMDFMYRQSLEVLGRKDAWLMSDEVVRELLMQELNEKGFEAILPVIKWNYVRVSSLFMYMFPNDWLTRYLEETTWFHKNPILEFREPNNDFNALGTTKKIVGLVQRSLEVGEFEYIQPSAASSEALCWRLLLGLSVRP